MNSETKKGSLTNDKKVTNNSGGECTLLSAYCKHFGYNDDGYERLMLTELRDGYMQSTEENKKLVEKYYKIAPKIVEKINSSSKNEIYYLYISQVICNCIRLIEIGSVPRAASEYRFMVINLKKEFDL